MKEFLDSVGVWFQGIGVHPVIGAFLVGFIFAALIFRSKKSSGTGWNVEMGTGSAPSKIFENMKVGFSSSANIAINGKEVEIPPESLAQIMELIKSKKLIEAIKVLRSCTSLDLKDAKNVVETIGRTGSPK